MGGCANNNQNGEQSSGTPLQPVKLFPDFQRLFVHGTGATTMSLYLQGNVTFGKGCSKRDCNVGCTGSECNPGSWNVSESCAKCYCHTGSGVGRNPTTDKYAPQAARIVFGVFDTSSPSAGAAGISGFNSSSRSVDAPTTLQAVAFGMFPAWTSERTTKAKPFTYVYSSQSIFDSPGFFLVVCLQDGLDYTRPM